VESEAMVGTYEYMDMGFQKKAGPMMTSRSLNVLKKSNNG